MFAKLKKVVFILLLLQLIACSRTEFTDAQGNEFGWDDFRGRWLVINYWAEWCKPCLEEILNLISCINITGMTAPRCWELILIAWIWRS